MMQRGGPSQQPNMQGAQMMSAPPATAPTNFGNQQQQQLPGLSMQNNAALSLQHQQHHQTAAQFQVTQQQLMQQQAAVAAAANLQNRQNTQQMYQQQQMQQQAVNMQQVNMVQQQQHGMVPGQQQQHIPHQGLNGGWQSDKDTQDRRKMIAKIVQLLQQRKPNAPQEWLKKLPQMAKRLEESLYRSAPSFEAYNDFNTLKQRLQQLAMNIGMNKTKNKGMQGNTNQMVQQQQQQQSQHFQVQQPLMQQQQRQAAPTQQLNGMNANAMSSMQPLQAQQSLSLQQPQMPAAVPLPQQPPPPQRQMVNMHDINPTMGQSQSNIVNAPQAPPQPLLNSGQGNSMTQVNNSANMQQTNFNRQGTLTGTNGVGKDLLNGMQNPQHVQSQQQQQLMGQNASNMNQRQNNSAPAPVTSTNGANNVNTGIKPGSDRQQVLRHQQQRLLLLRHAAKCPHEDGRCPVTPHCAGMKRLWKHIAECKDQKCLVPHCVSSRYVLSHYHRCKDVRCPVCGPVREAIHRSHEKAKLQQMQQMKTRDGNTQDSNSGTQQQQHLSVQPNQQQTKTQQLQQPFLQQQQQNQVMQNSGVPLSAPLGTNISSPTDLQQAQKRRKTSVTQNNAKASPANMMNAINLPRQQQQQQQQLPMQPLVEPSMQQLQQPKPFMQTPQQQLQQSQQHPQQTLPPQTQGMTPQATPSNVASNQLIANQSIKTENSAPQQTASTTPVTSTQAQVVLSASQTTTNASATPSKEKAIAAASTPQEDHTLINCFTNEQIETHIASLNKGLQLPPTKLKTKCLEVLKILQSHQHGWVFNAPVDPVELGLPDYFHVIKRPMDLGTIKKRLENGCYHAIKDFEGDVHLTFDNAMLYNQEGSVVYNMAREMKEKFTSEYDQLMGQLNAEEDEKRKNGDACSLCGCEKLLFEPPVFYCNGMNCPSKRIRRNTYYYVAGNNQFHWCHQCFGELKDNQTIEMGDLSTKKSQLTKKKNDEVHEESWVQCDKCERWVHQICALFNTRQNKDQRSEYTCPKCTIETRKAENKTNKKSRIPMAKDLPRTKLSEWLEDRVRGNTENFLVNFAKEKADAENLSVEEARKLMNSGPVTIRQVTSMDRKLEVRDRMRKRYAFRNYPEEFTYRCKCIVVFQNLDGVDVILFGLYVYEHDEKNPPPNQRAVYISYLDSVHYMRPRKMRTFVYHEILIAYLDYVRRKGFSTAHIWACPPLKGDDYILYAKPEDQKTPKDDRLRQWYLDMLVDAQKRGVVGKLTNMHDLYFSNEKHDASIVPYMEGDYFPAEAENIIKDIEEGKNGKKSGSGGKKNKSKSKDREKNKSSSRGGTRSSGIDEEALAASGIMPPGMEKKSLEEGGRDYVMAKLGETIYPMRESFIVAFLSWEGAKEENLVVPKEIEEYRAAHNISCKICPPKIESSSSEEKNNESGGGETSGAENGASKKRDAEGNQVNIKPDSAPSSSNTCTIAKPYKVIDDDLEELDCEFLNNRQAFLNLCQGNHYQFDQLRRAKHTSMMVLWHLHNRDAPKFVQQCAVCSREILTGYRYHCPICADYDQCQQCVSKSTTPRHPHQLKPIAVGQQNELTEAQRKERQRSIQLHMQLLYHAATCVSPKCPSANCTKMKGLLKHGAQCQIKAGGGCHVCKRIWALLQIHARQCKQSKCPVPNCMAIRERFRQLKQQQQAMDDRRRQNMNLAYRGAAR